MIYFFCIQKKLWQIYAEVCSPQGRSDADLIDEVSIVADQAVLCRCSHTVDALRLYGCLISIHRPALAGFFNTSQLNHVDSASVWSELTLYQQLDCIKKDALFNKRLEYAFLALLQSLADLTSDPELISRYIIKDTGEMEKRFLRDPSQPENWLDMACAHYQAGSVARARQFLHRTATSKSPAASDASLMLHNWVASVWLGQGNFFFHENEES